MPEDDDDKVYKVKAVDEESKDIDKLVDEKLQTEPTLKPEESPLPDQDITLKPAETTQVKTKGFQMPAIPTDKIMRTLTDRDMMRQAMHDETLEPHIHLAALLLIVFLLAIVISLMGI